MSVQELLWIQCTTCSGECRTKIGRKLDSITAHTAVLLPELLLRYWAVLYATWVALATVEDLFATATSCTILRSFVGNKSSSQPGPGTSSEVAESMTPWTMAQTRNQQKQTLLFHFRFTFQENFNGISGHRQFVRELPLGMVYPCVPFLDILLCFLTSLQRHIKNKVRAILPNRFSEEFSSCTCKSVWEKKKSSWNNHHIMYSGLKIMLKFLQLRGFRQTSHTCYSMKQLSLGVIFISYSTVSSVTKFLKLLWFFHVWRLVSSV